MKLYEVLVTLFVGYLTVACQSTCEEAQEKFDSCEDEIAEAQMGRSYSGLPFGGLSDECNEDDQCVAPCILEADCAAIAWCIATGGAQADPNNPPPPGSGEFLSCIDDCFSESK